MDPHAPTVHVPLPPAMEQPSAGERLVTPLSGKATNEGSMGEVLPDPEHNGGLQPAYNGTTPAPGGPHRVGRFELRRQLGKGGCGIVFLAYDPRLQREVALKIPRPEMLMNPDARKRLVREATAAAEFDHPNLVPVYESGEIGPLCFIATAFCPGQTLAEWLDRQAFPVPVRQAARLIATVAEAVQHAHDRGVLHRDLKPNNVILQEMKVEESDEPPPGSVQLRGDHFVPRVVDFGLAKLLERGNTMETATRQILGTPKYMSPEQALARREDIGPTADVYALGVVLYEMVAGRAPYDGASDVEVLRQAVEGQPSPPRHLRPDVPRDLEAICLKAMARSTAQRYRTAIDLADDLRRFLDGRPTIARPLKWPGRAARWVRRNDRIVAIVILVGIALFFTTVATWNTYQTHQLRSDRDMALQDQAERARTEQKREYARRVREAFVAWQSGDTPAALEALAAAESATAFTMESPDFTYDYLTRLLKSGQITIVCPAGSVTALAVSSDGTRIASGHGDGTLTIWNRSGEQLGSVKAHETSVTHLAFALNGTRLLTASVTEGTGQLLNWNMTLAGGIVPAPVGQQTVASDISCFAISADGNCVFTGRPKGSLLKIHLLDSEQNATLPGIPDSAPITSVTTSHDGKWVITADGSGHIQRWTANLKRDDSFRSYKFTGEVSALAVTEIGLPAIGFVSGKVFVVAPDSSPQMFSTDTRVHWIAIHPTNGFALGATPGRVLLRGGYDLPTGDTETIRAGVFSPDGKTLFTGSSDGIIRSWNVANNLRERVAIPTGQVNAIGVHTDGGHGDTGEFVVASERQLAMFDTRNPTQSWSRLLDGGKGKQFCVVHLLNDGTTRGVTLEGKSAVIWNISAGTEQFRVQMPDDHIATTAALTLDGSRLAVGDDAGQVIVWSVSEKSIIATIDTGVRRPVQRVVLTPEANIVAAPVSGGIGMWMIGDSSLLGTIPVEETSVFRFVPTGDLVITAGRGGVVKVWNLMGREQLALYGHVGRVTGLGISPNGRTLVTGGASGEVKFWDMRTGQELIGLRRHSTAVTVIEFAASGKFLVTGGEGQVAIWDARE
ncbi:MAG: serine/threonine-protein kinase [Planctomycetia bacterium]|nr:serine/threonine-protein kinase [Planctomycetia bacterium]